MINRRNRKNLLVSLTTNKILIVAFIIVVEIPVLLASILYYKTERKSLKENIADYEWRIINESANEFSGLYLQFNRIKYEITALLSELNVMGIFPYEYTSNDITNIKLVENMLQSIRRTVPGISDIYVIRNSNPRTVYSSIPSNTSLLLQKPWLQQSFTSSLKWYLVPPREADYYYSNEGKRIISFITGMINTDADEEFDFLIQIDVRSSYVENIFYPGTANNDDSFLALDCKNDIVLERNYSNHIHKEVLNQVIQTVEQKEDGVYFLDGQKHMVIKHFLEDTGLTIYKIRPMQLSENEIGLIKKSILLIVLSTMFAIVIGFLLAYSISRPIQDLIKKTKNIVKKDKVLELPPLHSSNKDIQTLENSFNIMIARINSLICDNIQKEKEKKDIEIRMLQKQMSPHFLYNTLNSIKFMAFIAKQKKIADAIVSLVDLLEYCFKDNQTMVPVRNEIDFIKQYIALQTMRYGDNIRVDFDLEEDIHQLYIQKFTLHPGIENSFIHAFNKKVNEPFIIVKGFISDSKLIFQIEDNGVGFDIKSLDRLTGIGIHNVNERICLTFGDEYGQIIESSIGKGTKVTITLPIIKDREG